MADVKRSVAIIFQGEDRLSKAMRGIEGKFSKLEGLATSVSGPLAGVADTILKIDTALAALAVGGLALSVNEAGKFKDSFNEISTLLDITGAPLDRFKGDILNYARDSKQSLESVSGAIYASISAGVKYKDALGALSTAEKLAIASKADLKSTAVLLTGTLNAYGESTESATRYSDVFFQTVRLGQTTLPELASSLAQVTGVAAAADIPIETLGASLAALTAAGLPTSQATTALKAAISNIIKPSAQAAKAAKALGLDFGASALKAKGFDGVLKDVYTATGGNIEQMGRLFGSVEGLNAALILSKDAGGKFSSALRAMREASGATEEAFAKMADNFALINQNIANNVRATLIQVGQNILSTYGDIGGQLSEVFKGIGKGLDAGAFDPLFEAVKGFGKDLELLLAAIAENLPEAFEKIDFSGLIEAFGDLGEEAKQALEAVFGEVDLTTAEGLTDLLQRVVDGLELLTNVTAGIVASWRPFLEGLGMAVERPLAMDTETQKTAGRVLGFGQALDKVLKHANLLSGAFTAMSTALTIMAGASVVRAITGLAGLSKAATMTLPALGSLGTGVAAVATGPAGLLVMAGAAGYAVGTLANRFIPGVQTAAQKVLELTDRVLNFTGTKGKWNEFNEGVEKTDRLIKGAKDSTDEFGKSLEGLEESAEKGLARVQTMFDDIEKSQAVLAAKAREAFDEMFPPQVVQLEPEIPKDFFLLDGKKIFFTPIISEAGKAKAEKLLKGMPGVDEALTAKIDIDKKRLRKDVKEVKKIIEPIGQTFTGIGRTMSNLWGQAEGLSGSARNKLMRQLRDEGKMRKETFEQDKKLKDLQIKMLEESVRRAEAGEVLIDFTGIDADLEAILWKIMERVQKRVNETYGNFLLGVGK